MKQTGFVIYPFRLDEPPGFADVDVVSVALENGQLSAEDSARLMQEMMDMDCVKCRVSLLTDDGQEVRLVNVEAIGVVCALPDDVAAYDLTILERVH